MLPTSDLKTSPSRQYIGCADVVCAGLQFVQIPPAPLTEGRFCDWIASALVGESIQYHEGHLMVDRSVDSSTLPSKERNRVHALARRAWIASELGLVRLYSVKVEEFHFRYFAVRCMSFLKPPEIRICLRKTNAAPAQRTPH